jgi:hypothetical protein
MRYSLCTIVLFLFLSAPDKIYSQNDFSFNNNNFSFGVGAKLTVEFSFFYRPDFKLGITGGVSYNAEIDNTYGVSPTIHGGFLFFNGRSVGADQSHEKFTIQSHAFLNTTAVFQLDRLDFNPINRPVPLYHFAEFTANPLQNPYKSSVSYGMNLILVHDKKLQRTGFFNLNVVGRFQLSYYNDGGPVLGWAGDNRDRYYTGGIVLSYHGDINDVVNLVELSYHKFTGYQKYAFDVAEQLQIDFLNYHDTEQFKYNQQRWRLNVTNLDHGVGGSISLYNANRLDFQDFLHFTTNVPYHPDYFKGYRWMMGGRYEYNTTKL